MGERSEIYIRDKHSVVELWRHYNSNEDFMVDYIKDFAKYAAWSAGDQRHWLTYAEDVAAMMIAFDRERNSDLPPLDPMYRRPDLRPRGDLDDFEYIWILDLEGEGGGRGKADGDPVWVLRGYVPSPDLPKDFRDAIRRRSEEKELVPSGYLRELAVIALRPSPPPPSESCALCGYTGPLLVQRAPKLCAHCLRRLAMNPAAAKILS